MENITTLNRKESLEAVDRINDELNEKYGKSFFPPSVSIEIYGEYIGFNYHLPSSLVTIPLSDGAEDDRLYNENDDSYESYYSYIKRKYDTILIQINCYRL